MSKKLFVGGLAWATTDATLHAAFEPFGQIAEAKVICDHQTGRSRGFGFVTYADENSAKTACETMNEQQIDGRTVRVSFADQASPRAKSNDRPRKSGPRHDTNDARPTRERREYKSEHPRFQPSEFPQDIPQNRRDNRKKDRKSDRDRYEDEERW